MTTFATCSYYEFRREMGIPVRSSLGFPKFTLKYPLVHAMPDTYPKRQWLRGVDKREFVDLYRTMIETKGVERLREQAAEIRAQEQALRADAADLPVVLLCFERWDNPKKQPEYCHRHVFAAVWRDLTGEDVPEFGAMPRPETKAQERAADQFGLF
ncbi:hypothetical protein FB384_004905 [Prauserella sediminis]|uniref:DUF488 domain-containing protein n=1 Tax=Prauserella sediminis TaxID=577680 RepID=A0A839Y0Z5_9PSEU|nr:hypothetical protein [Prauserella sediminis]MBB3665946.1 hypothetical protein [Prauserella sediminis]